LFNGFSLNNLYLNLLPFPIDIGVVSFKLQKGYLTLQSTPDLSSQTNQENISKYIDLFLSGDEIDLLGKNDVCFTQILKKAFVSEMKKTDFKRLLGNHHIGGVKSAYKGYKFFEALFNLPNPDYDHEVLSDL
jgi:hypothetical protein